MEQENPFDDYLKNTEKQAGEAFSNHTIRSREDGRWVIARCKDGEWSNIYLAEIIVGVFGSLIVHGDIDAVIFGNYGKNSDPLQVVNWIAHSSICGYLESKAIIGMTAQDSHSMVKRFDPDVAIWEINGHIKDRLEERESEYSDKDETHDEEIAAWRKAIRAVKGGVHWEVVRSQLYEDLEDAGYSDVSEMIWDIGLVPSIRLYYAQAACRKLLELLESEDAEKNQEDAA